MRREAGGSLGWKTDLFRLDSVCELRREGYMRDGDVVEYDVETKRASR